MTELYLLNINDPSEAQFSLFYQMVSPEKQQRLDRFRFRDDAKRSLYGEIIARCLACRAVSRPNDRLVFGKNDHGKPFLENAPGFHYNISHSGEWVAVAWNNAGVGVDIQELCGAGLDLAKRFFTKDEYQALFELPEEAQTGRFYDLWALKESFIKLRGKGLAIPLNSFSFDISGDSIGFSSEDGTNPYFSLSAFPDGYRLAVCSETPLETLRPVVLEAHRIARFLSGETDTFLQEA